MGYRKNLLDDLRQQRITLLVDGALGERGGERALQSLPLLQACGFVNFSYFDSWRPRYTNGQLLPSLPIGYSYLSLAKRDYDRILNIENLAFFTRQRVEDDIFRGSGPIYHHLRTSKPGRICLVAESEEFSLSDSVGRTLAEEPWFCEQGEVIRHQDVVRDAISNVQALSLVDMRYCTSWAQCSLALAVSLVSKIGPKNQQELLDSVIKAPYLSFWDDISLLSPYKDERPDWLRFPVDKPWLVLSRHYGFEARALEHMWSEIEGRHERYLNPYTRNKIIIKEFRSKIAEAQGAVSSNTVASQMLRQFINCGEL